MTPVTNVVNNAFGGNKKQPSLGIQVPLATSNAEAGLGDRSARVRGGVLGPSLGVQNYGVVSKLGG